MGSDWKGVVYIGDIVGSGLTITAKDVSKAVLKKLFFYLQFFQFVANFLFVSGKWFLGLKRFKKYEFRRR